MTQERGVVTLLFRRNIEPYCCYCKYGMTLGFNEVACSKRGIMAGDGNCGAFRYEPTKREPEFSMTAATPKVSEEDMRI